MYELIEVGFHSTAEWDSAISSFDYWHFYHLGAWLDFIEQTQPATRKIYGIYQDNVLVGYLPGFVVSKGPIRIFGSPLPGWTTPYMGPVVDRGVDVQALFYAISKTLKRDHFKHAEIRHNVIGSEACPEFHEAIDQTYVTTIQSDPASILASFSKSTRQAIRRVPRNGIYAVTTDNSAFVDYYYQQLCEVFAKREMRPTYPKERVQRLWNIVMPTGRLLPTMVMKGDVCIATRIDLCGNDCLHSFGSASRRNYLKYYPNELARYHAICAAAKRGLTKYDMTGGGTYKAKFNAKLVDIPVVIQSSPVLMVARNTLKTWQRWKSWLKYRMSVGVESGV